MGDAISNMNESGIRHIVVTSGGYVAGMISMRDVVALFGTHLGRPLEEPVKSS